MKKKERLRPFFEKRSGADQLSIFLLGLVLICLLFGLLLKSLPLFVGGMILLLYLYYRIFSQKKEKRRAENMRFIGFCEHVRFRFQLKKMEKSIRKTDRYLTCRGCGKKYRTAKKHRNMDICCPHCGKKNHLD